LNKSLGLAPALGVTKFTNVRDMILITLCCVLVKSDHRYQKSKIDCLRFVICRY